MRGQGVSANVAAPTMSAGVSTWVSPEQQNRVDAIGAIIEGVRLQRDARCIHQVLGVAGKNADGEIHGASEYLEVLRWRDDDDIIIYRDCIVNETRLTLFPSNELNVN